MSEETEPEIPGNDAIPPEGLSPLGDEIEDDVSDDDVPNIAADDDTPVEQGEEDPAVSHEPVTEEDQT